MVSMVVTGCSILEVPAALVVLVGCRMWELVELVARRVEQTC
jgi:hypothetical protein